jgi:hypothetical protein
MQFVVSRTKVSLKESKKPCDEAREVELTPLDYRTVKTLEAAQKKIWYKDWIDEGINHREEGGLVVCDRKVKEKQWVIELETLEELIGFENKYGEIMIMDSAPYKEAKQEIKIMGSKKK